MKKFFFIGFILVASCQPIMEKRYDFVPPQDKYGKECVHECLVHKDDCLHSSQRRKERCLNDERIKAQNAYQQYVSIQIISNKDIIKTYKDFIDYSVCNSNYDKNCTKSHQMCFKNCGGQIVEREVCVAFCN